jgi:hypothetical protein
MISDVLSEFVKGMDWYLSNPTYNKTYSGELRNRLLKLKAEATVLRAKLDAPPTNEDMIRMCRAAEEEEKEERT